MQKEKKIEQCLQKILKKGDLYEVITYKKNRKMLKYPVLKAFCFVFSRIAYFAFWGMDFLYNRFFVSPAKIEEAQSEIRKYLGVNVDIARNPFFDISESIKKYLQKELYIIYENPCASPSAYITDLEKIVEFCQTYSIPYILLKEQDLERCGLIYVEFGKYIIGKEFQQFTKEELTNLISLLKQIDQITQKELLKFLKKIKDSVITNAITKYYINHEKAQLMSSVKNHLEVLLNSNGTHKDKIHKKVYETVFLQEEYAKVITKDSFGKPISHEIMPLFEYLGYSRKEELLQETEEELLNIAQLYFYLRTTKPKKEREQFKQVPSNYDKLYQGFKKKEKVEDLFRNEKARAHMVIISKLLPLLLLPKLGVELTKEYGNLKENTFLYQAVNQIDEAYKFSAEIEEKLLYSAIKKALEPLGLINGESFISLGQTGDVTTFGNYEVAKLEPLQEDAILPEYLMNAYAQRATYKDGKMEYELKKPLVYYNKEGKDNATFELIRDFEQHAYDETHQLVDYYYNFLAPTGQSGYSLTSIYIKEENQDSQIDVSLSGSVSKEQGDILKSMKNPEIHYVFAPIELYSMGFKVREYFNLGIEERILKICEELQLPKDASLQEIFAKIQSKNYSKTPIEDADLTEKIPKMNEKEFLKSVASMDSLVCNLAATLAVAVDDDLVYSVGYYVKGENKIDSSDAHAWAFEEESGKIVDITPANEKPQITDIFQEIMQFCIEKNLGIYGFFLFATWIGYLIFGKRIKFTVKIHQAKKILENPQMKDAYAWLNEILYGGVNIAVQKTPREWLDTLKKEYSSYSKEELKELRKELAHTREDKKREKFARKLVNNAPFILENEEILTRKLTKPSKEKE